MCICMFNITVFILVTYSILIENVTAITHLMLISVTLLRKLYIICSFPARQVSGVARIECAAEGQPPPEISLQKDGSDDFPAARERRLLVDSKETVFFIKPVTAADEGTYTCSANSTAGSTRASANITVWQAPFFLQPVRDASFRPGDTAVLHCQVRADIALSSFDYVGITPRWKC